MWAAVLDDTLPPISAVMVQVKDSHIIYRYSGNHPDYLAYNGNTFLLWYVAEFYRGLGFNYIDLGGSKVKSIDDFKRRLSTSTYQLKAKPWWDVLFKKAAYHIKRATK